MLTLSSVVASWAGSVFPLALLCLSGPLSPQTQVTRVKRVALLLRELPQQPLPSCGCLPLRGLRSCLSAQNRAQPCPFCDHKEEETDKGAGKGKRAKSDPFTQDSFREKRI